MGREEALERRYGGKEGLKKMRQEWQRQSRQNPKVAKGHDGPTGFRMMHRQDPDAFREMSREAAKKRWNAPHTEDTPQGA